MLIQGKVKFIKARFQNEAELENVVIDNYEYLFGPNSFYLPKTKIKTADGVGTIPDGFAIDIEQRRWYLVEAELIHHSVWNHIAVHHNKPLYLNSMNMQVDPKIDLEVVCPNCHSMLHRDKKRLKTVKELRDSLEKKIVNI